MRFSAELAEKICNEMGIKFNPKQKGITINGEKMQKDLDAHKLFSTPYEDWIDNADSYICPMCRFECNSPLHYSKTATCPRCGFTPTKYRKLRYVEYIGMNRIIVFYEIMKNYRNGVYGDSNITLSEIFVRAGYPNLIEDMTDEELTYLRDSSDGMLHRVFSFEISKRKTQQDSNGI